WTGRPPLGDRLIVSDAGAASALDQPLLLPDRLDLGLGFPHRLGPRLAAVAEVTAAIDVGERTATVDAATAIDAIAGVQARLGSARLRLGLCSPRHDAPSGGARAPA